MYRSSSTAGTRNAKAKLNENKVYNIRISYRDNEKTIKELANEYNVTESAIYSIVNFRTWGHVTL